MSVIVAAVLATLAGAGRADAATCTRTASPDPSIPTWSAVNHTTLGAQPASDGQIEAYVAAVSRASDRVTMGVAGDSVQGRPLEYAVISAAGTPVAAVQARMRGLRAGDDTAAQADAIAARNPALATIAGSVHSNEPSGADADMELLYDLAADRDCATQRLLHRLIVTLLPVQNPDGRVAVTRVNANGFDLNRDWFADTQPETQARLALLESAPPMLFVDQHEQDGSVFFFPPNGDPVNHELPDAALHAMAHVYEPALAGAFRRRGYQFETGTYDLLYPGYGDSSSTLLFGAAGMTFEAPAGLPLADRISEALTAARTALDAAATHKTALLRAWAHEWLQAQAEGAKGELAPNRVLAPGDRVLHPVPARRVYAYALGDGGEGRALAARLAAMGVRVGALRAATSVASFVPFLSRATTTATLPASTVVVSLDQPLKHWVEAVLDEDADAPLDRYYDVSAWSQPLAMGTGGGAIDSPLSAAAIGPIASPAAPAAGSAAYAWSSDSLAGQAAAIALLRSGIAVSRDPADGTFTVPGANLAAAQAALAGSGVTLSARTAVGTITLRAPVVAVLADDPSIATDPARTGGLSAAWARFVLRSRLGLPLIVLSPAEIDADALTADGITTLVVPDGPAGSGSLDIGEGAALDAFVRAGGTFVGERTRGVDLAAAADLSTVAITEQPTGPGALAQIALVPTDPLSLGQGADLAVTNVGDPVLEAPGATAAAQYPSGSFFVSGLLPGRTAYAGSAAVTDAPFGAGRVVLFAFDAAYRAYSDASERLLANALLISTT